MDVENQYRLIQVSSLTWPRGLQIPSKRFRLFVAADATVIASELIAEFSQNALEQGMVYLCAWGPDCQKVHDLADGVVVADELGKGLVIRPTKNDTIMTTWHDESLEDALDFFVNASYPTEGFAAGSDFWLAVCVNNPAWAHTIERRLARAHL